MKGSVLAKANLIEATLMTKMETNLNLPFLTKFSAISEYRKLKVVAKEIERKTLIKYINTMSGFSDYNEMADNILKGKLKRFLIVTNKNSEKILRIFKKYSEHIHDFELNLPVLNKNIDSDEYYKFMVSISKFDQSFFYKILQYSNHKKVRKAIFEKNSKNKIDIILNKISATTLKRNKSLENRRLYGKNWRSEVSKNEILKSRNENTTYVTGLKIPGIDFIKDKILADYWGKETLCCLKIGGAASSLLDVIEDNPIAGELVGKFKGHKISSFVWDMVEIENGVAKKTLILDNVEANKVLSLEDTSDFLKKISECEGYKNIYLGTVRNDLTIPEHIKNHYKERQSEITGFDNKNKQTFAFADSKNLFTISTREDDTNFKIRSMNISDLYNIKYIEKHIYPGCDEELLNNIKLDSPCYIVDSKTHIAGYFLTRFKYFKKDETDFHQDNEIKWYDLEKNKKYIKKLYIEDIFLMNNKKIKYTLKEITEKFISYCKDNSIKSVMINPNENSKSLLKRLETHGIKVELENLGIITPSSSLSGTLIVESVESLI